MKLVAHEYSDLRVINRLTPFGNWTVQEFFLAWMNPNPEPIWTRAGLIADDPGYVYKDGQIGKYFFPERFLQGFSIDERFIGANENMLERAFDQTKSIEWKGSVRIESFNKDGLVARPFYSVDPHLVTSTQGIGSTQPEAYNRAWQGYSGQIPVEWDEELSLAICAYANYWFGHKTWPQGWSTVVGIVNGSGVRTKYTVRNHLYGLFHGSYSQPCALLNEGVTAVSISLDPGARAEINPFIVPLTAQSMHDTVLSFEVEPILAGSEFYVYVVPNPTGKSLCP